MRNRPMDLETIRARFPRLIRSMRWAAILTESESVGAIYMHQLGDKWAGEAVNHFGGVGAVLCAAMHARHYVRTIHAPRSAE